MKPSEFLSRDEFQSPLRNVKEPIWTRLDSLWAGDVQMLVVNEGRPTFRTLQGWATRVLHEAGAIRECEDHGWMKDRADPHAHDQAREVARTDPPGGVTPSEAIAAIEDVLASVGDKCPECPPDCG